MYIYSILEPIGPPRQAPLFPQSYPLPGPFPWQLFLDSHAVGHMAQRVGVLERSFFFHAVGDELRDVVKGEPLAQDIQNHIIPCRSWAGEHEV